MSILLQYTCGKSFKLHYINAINSLIPIFIGHPKNDFLTIVLAGKKNSYVDASPVPGEVTDIHLII